MSLNQQLLDLWCRFLLINEGNKLLVKKKEKKKLTGSRDKLNVEPLSAMNLHLSYSGVQPAAVS